MQIIYLYHLQVQLDRMLEIVNEGRPGWLVQDLYDAVRNVKVIKYPSL